jgi:hypothetical protein
MFFYRAGPARVGCNSDRSTISPPHLRALCELSGKKILLRPSASQGCVAVGYPGKIILYVYGNGLYLLLAFLQPAISDRPAVQLLGDQGKIPHIYKKRS